jgi:hypothetical protein
MFFHTASASGQVHLIRSESPKTLCGRKAASTGLTWPRWATCDASLDVRQRGTCNACAAKARINRGN